MEMSISHQLWPRAILKHSAAVGIASEALSKLRTLIAEGGYGEGTQLPSERELARQMGIGRPTLREAIKALCILDVLESRRGAGTFVKSVAPLHSGWPEQLSRTGTDVNLLELLELRKMLEPRAASLAATRGTENQLREIERERAALEAHSSEWSFVVEHNYLFHSAIIRAAGNAILEEVYRGLASLMFKSGELTTSTNPDLTRMHRDHRAIVEAIARGQADRAEKAMLEHLQDVGLDLISEKKR
jgi:GntR family transcriptional regulator, transcriptional repressor for pyruvate dehydrogenase complex